MKRETMDEIFAGPDGAIGRTRQSEIYVGGMSGKKGDVPVSMEALETAARQSMTPEAWAYIAGGAGMETTMWENRDSFERWRIVPRMLRDVSLRDTSCEVLGTQMPSPFLLAPIGVSEMAHPEADLAVARAAAKLGVPMIFSNQASVPMEQCAAAMGGAPRWFQLYWSQSNELVKSLVQRAERSGCKAIVVTLDTTLLGWRTRDLDMAYLPFLRGKGIAQYVSDPVFRELIRSREGAEALGSSGGERKVTLATIKNLFELVDAYPDSFWRNVTSGEPLAAVRKFIGIYSRPSLTWEDLAFLRECTKLPVLLKGILDPRDAMLAVDHGVDGIVVSNHGGRQVDGAIATIDALPRVVEAVGGKLPVLMDSGIRGGADIFKALALGARAVLLGRPWVYGLAAAGEAGVSEVLRNFQADFDLTMGLAGCQNVAEIGRDVLYRRDAV